LNNEGVLARIGGVLMLGVFGINVYIGLYDTNLAQISPTHQQLNWVIAAADLIAALFLLAKPRNLILKSLGGIVWPVIYIGSLFLDVETRLCLGAAANTCFPTVSDAYQYLILGSKSETWVLWPYTIRLGIALAVIVFVLAIASLSFRKPPVMKENVVPPGSQPTPPGSTSGTTQ
jgi:FtsH-binding integral membrane protein